MTVASQQDRSIRPANRRGAARLAAVQALYQMELADSSVAAIVAEYENFRLGGELDGEQIVEADPVWFRAVVAGVVQNQREIDPVIHAVLPADWPLKRIDILLRAVLRAGVFEIVHRRDVPPRVAVTEYVDVAHAFFTGEEPGMVNGVLDRIARKYRADEMDAPKGAARAGRDVSPG